MKIRIRMVNDTECEVTLTPSWIARLFGAETRRGTALYGMMRYTIGKMKGQEGGFAWCWKTTGREVEPWVREAIELAPVEDLPIGTLRTDKR